MDDLTDREWTTLFNLMKKAAQLKGYTPTEKSDLIRGEADERGQLGWLDEFCTQCEQVEPE